MNALDRLIQQLSKFPGIGPRQARRIAYYILKEPEEYAASLTQTITNARSNVTTCKRCQQFFEAHHDTILCQICRDPNRDTSRTMIVEKDSDLEAIEKSHAYNGRYFVLGATIPLNTSDDSPLLPPLAAVLKKEGDILEEIIIATSATPEGDHTADVLKGVVSEKLPAQKITLLGRGLSTGTELEYIDTKTMKDALENRK